MYYIIVIRTYDLYFYSIFIFIFFQNINILKKVKKEYVLPGCISYAKMNNKNMKYNNEIFHLSCLSTSLHMHTPHSTNI